VCWSRVTPSRSTSTGALPRAWRRLLRQGAPPRRRRGVRVRRVRLECRCRVRLERWRGGTGSTASSPSAWGGETPVAQGSAAQSMPNRGLTPLPAQRSPGAAGRADRPTQQAVRAGRPPAVHALQRRQSSCCVLLRLFGATLSRCRDFLIRLRRREQHCHIPAEPALLASCQL